MYQYEEILRQNSAIKKELALCQLKLQTIKAQQSSILFQLQTIQAINKKSSKQNEELKSKVQSLQREKKDLGSKYQQSIQQIKKSIDYKQSEIDNLENNISPNFDYAIVRMKIQYQMEQQYIPKIEAKQQQLVDLKARYNSMERQLQILQEKLRLKEKYVSNTINQMRQNHLLEIQNITKTIIKTSMPEENTFKEVNKRLKREVTDLREKLIYKEKQLQEVYQQKMNLKERMNEITISLNESALKSKQQSKIVRNEYQTMSKMVSQYEAKREQDKVFGTQKDREIKRLKTQLQEIQDISTEKDRKILKLQENLSSTQAEILKLKSQLSNENDKMNFQMIKNTLSLLEKDHETLRGKYEQLRNQNRNLKQLETQNQKEILSLNNKLAGNPKEEIDNIQQSLKKQAGAYQKIIKALQKQIQKVNEQKKKIDQKANKNKVLLKEANSKIMELIQKKLVSRKIQSPEPKQQQAPTPLLSPTPTIKKTFQFRSEGRFNPQNRLEHDLQHDFYGERKQVSRSRSPVAPSFRVQQYGTKTVSSGIGRSSFQFYEMAKRVQSRKVTPPCGHKHH